MGRHGAARKGATVSCFGEAVPDDVVYFAEEPGSWQLGVNWRMVFPAYFRCLVEMASPEEFARTIDQMIRAFAEHERPLHLRTAHKVASAAQQAALRALSGTGGWRQWSWLVEIGRRTPTEIYVGPPTVARSLGVSFLSILIETLGCCSTHRVL